MSLTLVPDRFTLFGAGEVCQRTGITYRQLDHWVHVGLVAPSIRGEGQGHPNQFDNDDIAWIQVVAELVALGVTPVKLREFVHDRRDQWVGDMQLALRRLTEVVPLMA